MIKNMESITKKWLSRLKGEIQSHWPFLLFMFVMLWQHAYIYFYHDDFGYASLSYLLSYSTNIQGNNYSFLQLLSFLRTHYITWGARVLPFFLLLSILRWDIWVFRIVQSIILSLIMFFSQKLTLIENHYKKNNIIRGLIACAFYGLISINLHQHGTYWASASVLYVWPFLWIFATGILNQKLLDIPDKFHLVFFLGLLSFASGFSQEQIAFPALFMLIGSLVENLLKRKSWIVIRINLISIGMLLIGFVFLIFAPGNYVRSQWAVYAQFENLNLFEKIRWNMSSLLTIMFGNHNLLIWSFVLIINILFLWNYRRYHKQIRFGVLMLNVIQIIYLLILLILLFGKQSDHIDFVNRTTLWFNNHLSRSYIFWINFIFFISLPMLLFSIQKHSYILFGLYIGGIISQLTMLFIPTINMRMGLIFLFSLFPILIEMFCWVLKNKKRSILHLLLLGILTISSIINTGSIIKGYKANSPYHLSNHNKLINVSMYLQKGEIIRSLVLESLPNDLYSGAMPYMPGYEYIQKFIKEYYDLPEDFVITWFNPNHDKNLFLEIIDYSSINSITAGVPFNLQPNGQSAFFLIMWFQTFSATRLLMTSSGL
jgi:hypothetical protein